MKEYIVNQISVILGILASSYILVLAFKYGQMIVQ